MLNVFFAFLVLSATFFTMEFVAWFTHKYVMHGFLWYLHEDHHSIGEGAFFEKNDSFFLIFAIPSWLCIMFGVMAGWDFRVWIGFGIAAYGLCYFIVHDIFIHQRFKLWRNSDNIYLRAIRKAHKVHHKRMTKEEGECFGMLIVPMRYFSDALKAVRIAGK